MNVQIDRYNPIVRGNARASRANLALVNRITRQGVLRRGGDWGTGCFTQRRSPTCMWHRTTWDRFTVTVRSTSKPTAKQWAAAINKKTSARLGNVRAGRPGAVRGTITVAWKIGSKASVDRPFGARHNVAQTLIGTSRS